MRNARAFLALWSALLALLANSSAQDSDRDYGSLRPKHGEQQEEIWVKRDFDIQQQLQRQHPAGMRKMSGDPSEKFWLHYWSFDEQSIVLENSTLSVHSDDSRANLNTDPSKPFALHVTYDRSLPRFIQRSLFARDAACPSNTTACASAGHVDSCCPVGDQCVAVTDTGNGVVGCCGPGQTCGNTISGCDTSAGYTGCPDSANKGCCIPGWTCAGNLCVKVGTQTVTASAAPATSTTVTPTSTSSPTSQANTVIVTSVNLSGFTTTATVTATVLVTPSTSSSSASAVAPVRPTSSGDTSSIVSAASVPSTTSTTSTTSPTSTISTTVNSSGCPTGYYMCSAVYRGGCCQVDRDCQTTFCPPTATTTIINGSPTVVAPTGVSAMSGRCPGGWYSCPASAGGGCCQNGYNCGQTDCPATISGVAAQPKGTPSEASVLALAWSFLGLGLFTGIGMVYL